MGEFEPESIEDALDDIRAAVIAIELMMEKYAPPGGGDTPAPPEPYPPPATEALPLKGYRWETSDNKKHMGQSLILPPASMTGNIAVVGVNGAAFDKDGEWKGQECWYGAPRKDITMPADVVVLLKDGTMYKDVVGVGAPPQPSGDYKQGRVDGGPGTVHYNPDGWKRGVMCMICHKSVSRDPGYIITTTGREDRCTRVQEDNGRTMWVWEYSPDRYSGPIWMVSKRDKIYYYISNPKKWTDKGDLEGPPPPAT